MSRLLMAAAATAALGTLGLAAPASAQVAAPVGELVAGIQNGSVPTTYTQVVVRRGYYGGPYRYGYGRPYYGPRYGYYPRGYYYRHGYGDALAAGALGLTTGAIIGGAIAQQAQPTYVAPNGSVSYCAQRYRSYDPASGTYLGYDGLRHPCP